MPQPLPSPYMPSAGPVLQAARMGESDRLMREKRGALSQAGQFAAQGELGKARDHLYGQGHFDEGTQIQQMIQQADANTLAKAKRRSDVLGNLALMADTPEKWQQAISAAEQRGMDVSQYRDFSAREMALAESDKTKQMLEMEMQRREAESGFDPTDDIREFQYAQQNPEFAEYMNRTKQPALVMKGESAFAKEYGGKLAEQVIKLGEQATAATDLSQRYEQIQDLLNDPDVYTGAGGSLINWGKKVGVTLFGQNQFKGLEEAEASEKTQKLLVGKIREMMGDQRMSDADRQFYFETIPNINDSPRGIALTVQIAKQVADHKRKLEAKALEVMDQNGGVMTPRAWSEFRRWQGQQNVFDPELMQMARREAKKAQPRGPSAGFTVEMDGQRYRKNPRTGDWEALD